MGKNIFKNQQSVSNQILTTKNHRRNLRNYGEIDKI